MKKFFVIFGAVSLANIMVGLLALTIYQGNINRDAAKAEAELCSDTSIAYEKMSDRWVEWYEACAKVKP